MTSLQSRITLGSVHNLRIDRGECDYSDWLWRALQDADKMMLSLIDQLLGVHYSVPSVLSAMVWEYAFEPTDPWVHFLCSFPVNAAWGSEELKAWWKCPDDNCRNWRSIPGMLTCLYVLGVFTPEMLAAADQSHYNSKVLYQQSLEQFKMNFESTTPPAQFQQYVANLESYCMQLQLPLLSALWRMPKTYQQRITSRLLDAILNGISASTHVMGLSNFGRVVDEHAGKHDVTFDDLNACTKFHPPLLQSSAHGSSWMFPVCVQQEDRYFLFEFVFPKAILQTRRNPSRSTYILRVANADSHEDWMKKNRESTEHTLVAPGSLISLASSSTTMTVKPFGNGGSPWEVAARGLLAELEAVRREVASRLGVEVDDLAALTTQLLPHIAPVMYDDSVVLQSD